MLSRVILLACASGLVLVVAVTHILRVKKTSGWALAVFLPLLLSVPFLQDYPQLAATVSSLPEMERARDLALNSVSLGASLGMALLYLASLSWQADKEKLEREAARPKLPPPPPRPRVVPVPLQPPAEVRLEPRHAPSPPEPTPRPSLATLSPPPPAPSPPVMVPVGWLVALKGPLAGRSFAIAGEIRIGRLPANEITLDDPRVSNLHARVVPEGTDACIYDCRSAQGTAVNHQRVLCHVLAPGDRISIGASRFIFRRSES